LKRSHHFHENYELASSASGVYDHRCVTGR
jgi:hypothetical protein